MIKQRRPLLSSASYWVTLQPSRPSYLVFAKQMKNVPAACRQAPMEEAKGKRRGRKMATTAAVTVPPLIH
jgi:hypothetical protein